MILLGPGKSEVDRVCDLLDGLRSYEPENIAHCDIIVVNDGSDHLDELRRASGSARSLIVMDNPADSKTRLWDRMAIGLLTGLHRVLEQDRHAFVVKLDTDALVINPFVERIRAFLRDYPGVGLAGSYRTFPAGEENQGQRTLRHLVANAERRIPTRGWLWRWHRGRSLSAFYHLVCRYSQRQRVLSRARANGYQPADHVQGGAYLITGDLLDTLRGADWFPDGFEFEWSLFGEDLLMSVCAVAAGFELAEFNRPGEVFGVWWEEPSLSAPALAEAGFGVVHAIKDRPGFDEAAFREWCRDRRKRV